MKAEKGLPGVEKYKGGRKVPEEGREPTQATTALKLNLINPDPFLFPFPSTFACPLSVKYQEALMNTGVGTAHWSGLRGA